MAACHHFPEVVLQTFDTDTCIQQEIVKTEKKKKQIKTENVSFLQKSLNSKNKHLEKQTDVKGLFRRIVRKFLTVLEI